MANFGDIPLTTQDALSTIGDALKGKYGLKAKTWTVDLDVAKRLHHTGLVRFVRPRPESEDLATLRFFDEDEVVEVTLTSFGHDVLLASLLVKFYQDHR